MAMNSYNRENPFMYLMEMKQEKLMMRTQYAIKQSIFSFIIIGLTLTLLLVNGILYRIPTHVEIGLILISFIIFIYLELIHSVKAVKQEEVNEMIFGDQYRDINVNNEKLEIMINEYCEKIGQINFVIESIYMINLVTLLLLSYQSIRLLSYFM